MLNDFEIKRCVDCNTTVITDKFKRTLKCEFCGSLNINDGDISLIEKIRIDKIIPFTIDEVQATEIFERWIMKGLWNPIEVSQEFRRTSAKGIFIPIWHFSFDINTYWYGHKKKEHKQTKKSNNGKSKTITIEEFIPRSGSRTKRYSLFIPASKSFTEREFTHLCPPQIENALPFAKEYLIKKQAEIPTLDRDSSFIKSKEEARKIENEYVMTQVDRIDTLNITFSEPISSLIYIPMWIFGFKYYNKYYKIIINGITGDIYGQKPISKVKVALAVAVPTIIIIIMIIYILFR
ncbi:MAG: hypothetical protein ACUVWP_05685 [bacterium]